MYFNAFSEVSIQFSLDPKDKCHVRRAFARENCSHYGGQETEKRKRDLLFQFTPLSDPPVPSMSHLPEAHSTAPLTVNKFIWHNKFPMPIWEHKNLMRHSRPKSWNGFRLNNALRVRPCSIRIDVLWKKEDNKDTSVFRGNHHTKKQKVGIYKVRRVNSV